MLLSILYIRYRESVTYPNIFSFCFHQVLYALPQLVFHGPGRARRIVTLLSLPSPQKSLDFIGMVDQMVYLVLTQAAQSGWLIQQHRRIAVNCCNRAGETILKCGRIARIAFCMCLCDISSQIIGNGHYWCNQLKFCIHIQQKLPF